MNILVVGSGGREHAFISALLKSRFGPILYAAPGNAGISESAVCLNVKETDAGGIAKAAVDYSVDIAVVSSEAALAAGVADELEARGIRAFGPKKIAAVAGISRTLAKQIFKKYNIPAVKYSSFDNFAEAEAYVGGIDRFPVSIKSDGLSHLTSVVANDKSEAVEALRSMASGNQRLSAGSHVTVEENGEGREFVVPVFTDGKKVAPMPPILPYRRAMDGNFGKNTEGMGSMCPAPFCTADDMTECVKKIFLPAVEALSLEGRFFRGILQFVLAYTEDGIKAVELAPCIGDTEAETALPLLETDIVDILNAVIDGTLPRVDVRFSHKSAASVVAAAGGYPDAFSTGSEIRGLSEFPHDAGLMLFHIATGYKNGALVTDGGRVFSVTAVAENADSAAYKAYQNVSRISFDDMYYRHDIGKYRI